MSDSRSGTGPRKRVRKRWGWRRIHKWLAVAAGVVLTVWIVSGVIIAIPGGGTPRFQQVRPAQDLSAAVVSPAEAAAAFEFDSARVRGVLFKFLGSRPVYHIQVAGRGPTLVDATSGERVEIDGPEAVRIASAYYGGSGSAAEPELVTGYGFRYFVGALPAYRVAFDDEHDTEAYVAIRDGTITWWDGRARSRRLMAAAHDWWPLGTLVSQSARMAVLVFAAVVSLAATVTGYWLALRRKRRRA